MSWQGLATWAGYESGLVEALAPGAQRRLGLIGLTTPAAALVVGFGARRWLLDAGAGAPAALVALVAVAVLAAWTTRLLVAGGGLPARDAPPAELPPSAATATPPAALHYRPAWLAPLWQLGSAAIWTLPLAAHASVELRLEPSSWPRGVAGWLLAARADASSLGAWVVAFALAGAAPALLALIARSARMAHAQARAARDRAWIVAWHHDHRRGVALALRRAGVRVDALPPDATLDPPFATRPLPAPWQQGQAVEVAHLRWLLARQQARRSAGHDASGLDGSAPGP